MGAYKPHCVKTHFKISKSSKQNCACTSTHSMSAHKFSEKTFFVFPLKKGNFFMFSHDYSRDIFLFFYTDHIKCRFPRKIWCRYRISEYTREILPRNLLTFENFIFYAFCIIDSYAPMCGNTTSDLGYSIGFTIPYV
jgi:hypothetical protein